MQRIDKATERYVMQALVTDVEICGDVLRVVTQGAPDLQVESPADLLGQLRVHHDDYRRFLLEPPRGHQDVNACLLYPSFSEQARASLVVAAQFGYAPVAGTMVMAASAVLADQDPQPLSERSMQFDTAAGPQLAVLSRDGEVSWKSAPPKVLAAGGRLEVLGRKVRFTIVDTGMTYVVAEVSDLGCAMTDRAALSHVGQAVAAAAQQLMPLSTLDLPHVPDAYLVMLVGQKRADGVDVAWVSADGLVAHSAGGTGALAVLEHVSQSKVWDRSHWLTVSAPGGAFDCVIRKTEAWVRAKPRIIQRHQLLA